ncbi:N-acetylmuramoyl-L-alanine amidase [Bradyrhizobium sp. LHD-71]|uniref:N-acetylmuramoyl-L-alanine amidase family protein n=1 Tax=Bradyrhizobium sp. LHD-71 TaxID=3072141 RepID=UPI00280E283E|nr:N-acetylmuramoyl-L-alanine amidase [Bradyrhizobium sp. LHD-71]MDQ8726591.1 N-acetylmuramoyl-L-alanine amidase [Bradyrhizobium sp. LHD-71]
MRRRLLAGLLASGLTLFLVVCAQAGATEACKPAGFKILLDVGHTPEETGATSAHGNTEYEFNLSLANVAMAQLVDAGFSQTTLLLARGKGYAQLAQRAAIVNRTSPNSTRERYLSKWEFAGVERPYSDKFSGHSLFVSFKNLFRRQSTEFAALLGRELASANLRYTPQHAEDIPGARLPLIDAELGIYRYDNLVLLRDSQVPAVLLEAGLIINRKDEIVLRTAERQSLLARAITNAALEFCKHRKIGPPPHDAGKPIARAGARSG